MYRYLRQEVGDVVSDTTPRRFCDDSVANMTWLESHGVQFSGELFPHKTAYPVDGCSLYCSGNETDLRDSQDSEPAAWGHIPDGIAKLSAMGPAFFKPMAKAVAALAPIFFRQCRVQRLIVGPAGEVKGVELADFRGNRWAAFRHRIWSRLGTTGDDGSGVELGRSFGGKLVHMDRASGWRFISPPADWPKAILGQPIGSPLYQ
jgi:3-oxo-5alpha-steroid 4-dehydrogenase